MYGLNFTECMIYDVKDKKKMIKAGDNILYESLTVIPGFEFEKYVLPKLNGYRSEPIKGGIHHEPCYYK